MAKLVCVTGAAGQIAYSILPMIAKGEVFGSNVHVIINLLDIEAMNNSMEGVKMELMDCAFPLVDAINISTNPEEAFQNIDVAFLIGALPRKEGMERKDLLTSNANIFKVQGKALDKHAKKDVKILVVGNPANTNALICSRFAPSIPKKNFTAMTRLDENRAKAQIAERLGRISIENVKNVIIWGNHSTTQVPDISHGTAIIDGKELKLADCDKLTKDEWHKSDFIKTVASRGGAIIKARKLSSAMSAANAAVDHMRNWVQGTPLHKKGQFCCMGVMSNGQNGIPEGIIYSFPVTISKKGDYKVEEYLCDDFIQGKMEASTKELLEERDVAFKCVGLTVEEPKGQK